MKVIPDYEIGQANRLGNRNSNQDRFAIAEADGCILLVLADGMGGQAGGEMAADMLVDYARETFLSSRHPVAKPESFLAHVIRHTHRAILEMTKERGLPSPPGTTGVLCLIQDGRAQWAHVGDSRLYIFRNDIPLYRTRDHSYVERLYEQGDINLSDKSTHPMRNQITQCIGGLIQQPHVEVSRPTLLQKKDVILLCSDGLWGPLDDLQIGTMLNEGTLEEAVEWMAEEAERLSYPHSDNISVVSLRYKGTKTASPEEEAAPATTGSDKEAPLRDAIEEIAEVLRQYEDEMKG